MSEATAEVLVLGSETGRFNAGVVRSRLADQISQHERPNLALVRCLQQVKDSQESQVIISSRWEGNITVELMDSRERQTFLKQLRGRRQSLMGSSDLSSHHRLNPRGDYMTVGQRLLRKKIDRAKGLKRQTVYEGLEATAEQAKQLIGFILSEDRVLTIIHRKGGRLPFEIVDVFCESGMGIRIRVVDGSWFLQEFEDYNTYIHPENLQKR